MMLMCLAHCSLIWINFGAVGTASSLSPTIFGICSMSLTIKSTDICTPVDAGWSCKIIGSFASSEMSAKC